MNAATDVSVKYLEDQINKGQQYLTPYRMAGSNSFQTFQDFLGVNGAARQATQMQNIMQPALEQMSQYGDKMMASSTMQSLLQGIAPSFDPSEYLKNFDTNTFEKQLTDTAGGAAGSFMNSDIVKQSMDYMKQQGMDQIQNSAAAKGMLNSGRTLEELNKQGQGLAATNVLPYIQQITSQIIGSGSQLEGQKLGAYSSLYNQQLQNQTQIANTYAGGMMQAGASVANNSISNVQNGLASLIGQGTQAALGAANLAQNQANIGSGYQYQTGVRNADADVAAGKAQSDAINAIAQIQFQQDLGPYLAATGQAGGATPQGGSTGGQAAQSFAWPSLSPMNNFNAGTSAVSGNPYGNQAAPVAFNPATYF
jgi:hypothetical protein